MRITTVRRMLIAIAALALTSACLLLDRNRPEIQNHPEPEVEVEIGGFERCDLSGCRWPAGLPSGKSDRGLGLR